MSDTGRIGTVGLVEVRSDSVGVDEVSGDSIDMYEATEDFIGVDEGMRDGYNVQLYPADFIRRYRDISFLRDDKVEPTAGNVAHILKEAGIGSYEIVEEKILLRDWQALYLQELTDAINEERSPSMLQKIPVLNVNQTESCNGVNLGTSVYSRNSKNGTSHTSTTASNVLMLNDSDRDPVALPEPELAGSNSMISGWMEKHATHTSMPGISTANQQPESFVDQRTRATSGRRILDPHWWDRFQMLPREQVSSSATFQTVFKVFKVVCYVFIMVMVLGSAVVNKLCVLLMTSSITKDPLTEAQWPVKTMLVISMCFPYSIWFIVYTGKSMFGSTTWPSCSLLVSVLMLELLHTLGLSMLVFRVLPLLDMMRGFIVLGSIYIVPAFLKIISECRDPNTGLSRKCAIFILNFGAFLIQIGSIALCEVFHITMTPSEKLSIRKTVLQDNVLVVVPRPPLSPTKEYFSGDIMFELPLALLLISMSYWENYAEGDITLFGKTLNFKAWKKHLHHSRGQLYIFASIWKGLWVVAFAVLLQPGFKFNMSYTLSTGVNSTDVVPETTILHTSGQYQSSTMAERLVRRNAENDTFTVTVTTSMKTHKINFGTEVPTNMLATQSIENTTQEPQINQSATAEILQFYFSPETMKHLQEYGVLYLQITSNIVLAYFGSTACKLCMQLIGFSLPLTLTTPMSIVVIVMQCQYEFLPTGPFVWIGVESGSNMWVLHLVWLGVIWLSEIYITSHVWFPGNGRMEKIDRLFVIPIRCGILADQSLMLRRRRNDIDASLTPEVDDSYDPDVEHYRDDDIVPQIYACATMWHETRSEMTNLLKSIFRLDIDHSGRYLAQKFYKIRDPDYYEFEAHIFFDDAMELSDDDLLVPNMFVADLMECIDDSLSSVHERQMSLGPPMRTPTPYGGRLTWKLPGGTRLITHLKDNSKIRHKKRWSQVMYMYYLLGYRILARPESLLTKDMVEGLRSDGESQRVKLTESQLHRRRKAAHFTRSVIFNYVTDDVHTQAENTYILTLDGDVDFHPDAVRLLIDRLKTNKKVGAACGRIHPIGSGPLLWYQQFEYAIGHWLQKATEHVFGCVMCAPGCFSLFRGSALMDDNVARTYATMATEAGHHIQYDQGEDRWLSTLLLQQGYRIDYCAASDALTHAPETFSEFFKQRRRWGPSTLANIVDLLGSWKTTISINDNISTLYILYQCCLIISTILGPATILLMLAGAFVVVFKLTILESYCLSLIPAVFFIVVCLYAKPSTQLTIASILSAVFALLMTVVLVGTVRQAIDSGVSSPTVIFMAMLVLIFLISALMHPEEFFCVIPGALYFICLPTGYLLLTIYYLCNMNVVSWGTREVPKRKTKVDIEEEKRLAEENRMKRDEKKKGLLGLNWFFKDLGEFLKHIKNDVYSEEKSKTDMLLEELINEIRSNREQQTPSNLKSSTEILDSKCSYVQRTTTAPSLPIQEPVKLEVAPSIKREEDNVPIWLQHEDTDVPDWLRSNICGDGPVKQLPEKENIFWKQIISKYLHPLKEDKMHQEKVQKDLTNLRNNVIFGFFMTSALWIALSMQLQILHEDLKDILFFKIPRWQNSSDLAFEPLGLIFLAFFATILIVQFLGMFVHRWGTMLHMLSITDISCGKTFTEKDKVREIILKSMELQKLCNIENESTPDYDDSIHDYEDSDEDDILDTVSVMTGCSLLLMNPPSYQSARPVIPKSRLHHQQDIFNRRGNTSSAALRRAFEKRFRNETQEFKLCDSDTPHDGRLYNICENGATSIV